MKVLPTRLKGIRLRLAVARWRLGRARRRALDWWRRNVRSPPPILYRAIRHSHDGPSEIGRVLVPYPHDENAWDLVRPLFVGPDYWDEVEDFGGFVPGVEWTECDRLDEYNRDEEDEQEDDDSGENDREDEQEDDGDENPCDDCPECTGMYTILMEEVEPPYGEGDLHLKEITGEDHSWDFSTKRAKKPLEVARRTGRREDWRTAVDAARNRNWDSIVSPEAGIWRTYGRVMLGLAEERERERLDRTVEGFEMSREDDA